MDDFELFGSPIRIQRLSDAGPILHAARDALVSEAAETPGIVRSNMGGWHSTPDLTLRQGAPFAPLMQRLAHALDLAVHGLAQSRGTPATAPINYGIQAWGMVLSDGGYVVAHDHAEAHFSGVVYLDAGDPPTAGTPAGSIVFKSPIAGKTLCQGLDLFPSDFTVRPETGMLVIFPGHLTHYVHPYRGHRPRVCVSFNARLQS